jgi:glycosyltransferase involved in cell wall biosynthesis
MPISILEAMACGLPVIATSVGSIPEVIEDNVNGYLVAPHQPATLAAKMAQLVRDDDLRRIMGSANRDKVRRGYSFEEYERKLENIYLALLAE